MIRQEDTLGNVDIPALTAAVLLWFLIRAFHITVGKTYTLFDYRQLVVVLKKSNALMMTYHCNSDIHGGGGCLCVRRKRRHDYTFKQTPHLLVS